MSTSTSSSSLLPCQYCNVVGIDCPSTPVDPDASFLINYTFITSSASYPYEVRSLWIDESTPWDSCVYGVDVQPQCVEANASFVGYCPDGAAYGWALGAPVARVNYTVRCYAAAGQDEGNCDRFDSKMSCRVECSYCQVNQVLKFNVTTTSGIATADECTLYLWYNDSLGQLCPILPELGACAASTPYNRISVVSPGKTKYNVPVNTLVDYQVVDLVAPTRYMWNVRCTSQSVGDAFAVLNWTFRATC